ncbi:MAG: nuclear transport factor 2 family protein [Thermodesulfobacteriota bacterium]|nr:nuclear transport factor 2 family protein [Thermodesulfobacteriota bacterium]
MEINAKKFANEWIESWNSHDLDRILSHYSDSFEITTPMIKVALGIETGTLKGKEKIRNYWEAAFKKVPGLHFELKEVTEGVGSIAVYYKSVLGKMAIEVMFFNEEGKVNKVIVHYT